MLTKVTIVPVEGEHYLHCHFQGQCNPQPCFLDLDCVDATLTATVDGEIGSMVPAAVWHNRALRFPIGALKTDVVNALLQEALPLAERIVAGYASNWDGSNWWGKYNDDADLAAIKLQALCDKYSKDEENLISVYNADDYLHDSRFELGITAETTDAELTDIGTGLREDAKVDGIDVLHGLDDVLKYIREEVIAESD